ARKDYPKTPASNGPVFSRQSTVQSVKKLLPQQKRTTKRHQPAVPYLRVPEVMNIIYPNAIEVSAGRSALAFAILTAARSGEVRKMTWDQINWEEAFWHIPAANTKTGEAHTVPISTQALEVLKQRQAVSECEGGEVFRSRNRGPLSDMTLTKVLRDNNIESDVPGRTATAHGFRSSFRDWAAENGYSFAIAEFALAHALKGNAVRPYYRTRHLNERIGMMQKWGDYVFSASSLWKSSGSALKGKTA
ncbi:tyrosine-type recombinase/integrase, partial [Donghicola mangrovi]